MSERLRPLSASTPTVASSTTLTIPDSDSTRPILAALYPDTAKYKGKTTVKNAVDKLRNARFV